MKRLYTLLFTSALLCGAWFSTSAQQIGKATSLPMSDLHYETGVPEGPPYMGPVRPGPEANETFVMNYSTLAGDTSRFVWFMNSNWGTPPNLSLRRVIQGFRGLFQIYDSMGQNFLRVHDYATHSVTMDALALPIIHQNQSGQTNTLRFSIVTLNSTNGYFTNNVVWKDEVTFTSSQGRDTVVVNPSFTLCTGSDPYGVIVEYDAPAQDTLRIFIGYREACPVRCGASHRGVAWPNTFLDIYSGGMLFERPKPQMPGSTTYDLLINDCNQNRMRDTCEWWPAQNLVMWNQITVTDIPFARLNATKGTTPDNGTTNGTAWVSPTGGVGAYNITWGTTPPQMGDTARNLAAGRYQVSITYGHNCETIIENVDVLSNVGIEDQIAAGINVMETFPNPSSGIFTLNMELKEADQVNVKVYDLQGKVLYEQNENHTRQLTRQIDLGDAAAGMYLLRVETSKGAATSRISVR